MYKFFSKPEFLGLECVWFQCKGKPEDQSFPQLKVIYREINKTLKVSCHYDNYGKILAFI